MQTLEHPEDFVGIRSIEAQPVILHGKRPPSGLVPGRGDVYAGGFIGFPVLDRIAQQVLEYLTSRAASTFNRGKAS